jgi:hypothetical protein
LVHPLRHSFNIAAISTFFSLAPVDFGQSKNSHMDPPYGKLSGVIIVHSIICMSFIPSFFISVHPHINVITAAYRSMVTEGTA